MRIMLIISIIISQHCNAQSQYHLKLSARLEEIKELTYFQNDVEYIGFDGWDSAREFFQDDMVEFNGMVFSALVDSKGKTPVTSPNEWRLSSTNYHPYRFLRDTARTEDLKALLDSEHPFIRTYAFKALAHRNYDQTYLFEIVLHNLHDTAEIIQMTGDSGYPVHPADLMLWYTVERFSTEQKDILKELILAKYTHLCTLEEVLLFHKPTVDSYPFVKAIVNKGLADKFGLIALSQYCKTEDIEIIRRGFNLDNFKIYYGGYKVFFKAIENCPDESFKRELILYKTHERHHDKIDEYYVRALARYKDNDCLKVLKELAEQNSQSNAENLVIIYKALKKHYFPLYDDLMIQINGIVNDKKAFELQPNSIEKSPWNY